VCYHHKMEEEPKKHTIIKKLAILAVVGIVGALFLEITIAKVAPQKTTPYHATVSAAPLLRYGVDRPSELKPNMRLRVADKYLEFDTTVYSDSYGFRKREDADPTLPTVLVVGDSQTFGHGVENRDAYPNILNARYPNCQILNAGVPGTGLNYYFAYIRKVFDTFEFEDVQHVLVGLNMPGNDWYGMQSQSLKIDPELIHYTGKSPDHEAKKTTAWRVQRALRYSQLYSFLRVTVAPHVKRYLVEKFKDTSEKDASIYEEYGPAARQIIREMHEFGTEHGAKVTFLLLPERPHYFKKLPMYMEHIKAFMDENGFEYIDLVPPMEAEYTRFNDFWLPINGHYNEGGHTIIADEVERANVITCGEDVTDE